VENLRLAPLAVGHDLRRLELLHPVFEPPHLDLARRMDAVAAGDIARRHAVDLEVDDFGLFRLRPEGADHRVQRAHPLKIARAPAHRFRPGKLAHDLRNDLGDHLFARPPLRLDDGHIKIALLVGLDLGFADRLQPGALEKALDRLLGRAHARALLFLALVRLPRRQAVHRKREPPRRGKGLRPLIDQPARNQRIRHKLLEALLRLRLHARGNFFGEQFEKQIGHGISGPAGRGLLLASPPVHVTAYQPPPPPPPPPPPEPRPPTKTRTSRRTPPAASS
jgi:hypothetical protein